MMSPPQVLEHRELATARQKDRLNGNGRSGDYRRQLVLADRESSVKVRFPSISVTAPDRPLSTAREGRRINL